MTSILAAGLLLCSGVTNTFSVSLLADRENKAISAHFVDTEGTYGGFKSNYINLNFANTVL